MKHSKLVCFEFLRGKLFVQKEENGLDVTILTCIAKERILY